MRLHWIIISLATIGVNAQDNQPQAQPIGLNDVIRFVSNAALKEASEQTIEAIKLNGLGFELNENALSHIIDASNKGKRTTEVTAKLILQMFLSCPDCGSRYFGPLSEDGLFKLVTSQVNNKTVSPLALLNEVQNRGTKGIPKTEATIDRLLRLGVSPELIELVVPDDELELPPPKNYEPGSLTRAPKYDRKLTTGTASLVIEMKGQVRFLYRHNALYYQRLSSADKKTTGNVSIIASTYTAPIPKMSDSVTKADFNVLVKPGGSKILGNKKKSEPPKINYSDGGFGFILNETDKESHFYIIQIEYGIPTAPKMK